MSAAEQIKALNKRVSALEKKLQGVGPPGQQHKTGTGPQEAPESKSDNAPGHGLGVAPSPTYTNNSKHATSARPQRWKLRHRVWRQVRRLFLKKDRLERIGIVFGIIYAIITFWQWRDLRHNFLVEQRAWVKVVLDWSNFTTTNKVQVSVTNFGKDTASKARLIARTEIVDSKAAPSFVWKFRPHADDQLSLIFPGDSRAAVAASMLDDNAPRGLTSEESRALMDGNAYIIVWGFVMYADSFGQHWTRFCDWRDFSKVRTDFYARSCVVWNSVGDGKSPDE